MLRRVNNRTVMESRTGEAVPPDLGAPSGVGRFVVIALVVSFIIFGVWAAFAPLNRGVVASGLVGAEGRRTVVRHLEGGTLAELRVGEGETVKAGDILAVMDLRQARLARNVVAQRLMKAQIESAALLAEAQGLRAISWPVQVREALDKGDPTALEWTRIQTVAFQARLGALDAEVSGLRQQGERLSAGIVGLNSTANSLQRQASLVGQQTQSLRGLQAQGFAPRNRVLELERAGAEVSGRIGEARATIAQNQIARAQVQTQLTQTRAKSVEQAASRLSELQALVAEMEDRVSSLDLQIERGTIVAPVDGVVLARSVTSIGVAVEPGKPLFEIVPEGALVLRVQVRPTDIERIRPGSKAKVRFSGLSPQTTPQLDGKVVFVGGDVDVEPNSGQAFFQARIEVSQDEIKKLGSEQLRPGMPVEVFVDGGARTALEYLVEPVVKAYQKAFTE
jgi:membrane fusion protein, epimerase transport system